jgi:hypothetical protein
MKDRINIAITAEQAAGAAAAVEAVAEAMPYLITLSVEDRRRMVKAAEGTEGFIRSALELARQNPHLVPSLVDMAKLERDLALREALAPVEAGLTLLATKVNHTRRLANADLFEGCLDIYHECQRHGQDQGLDALVAPLRTYFKRRPRVRELENPTQDA